MQTMLGKILETKTKRCKCMKRKRKQPTLNDEINGKIDELWKNWNEKKLQKLATGKLNPENPDHQKELDRRLAEFEENKARQIKEDEAKKQARDVKNKLLEYENFESWDLEDVKKKTIAQWLREKLRGGVK